MKYDRPLVSRDARGAEENAPETNASRFPEDVLIALTSAGTMLSSVYSPTHHQYHSRIKQE